MPRTTTRSRSSGGSPRQRPRRRRPARPAAAAGPARSRRGSRTRAAAPPGPCAARPSGRGSRARRRRPGQPGSGVGHGVPLGRRRRWGSARRRRRGARRASCAGRLRHRDPRGDLLQRALQDRRRPPSAPATARRGVEGRRRWARRRPSRPAGRATARPARGRAARRTRPRGSSGGRGSRTGTRTPAAPPSRCRAPARRARRGTTYGGSGASSSAGAITDTSWPRAISASARSRTCCCTPPGTSQVYGQTMPTLTDRPSFPPPRPSCSPQVTRGPRPRRAAACASPRGGRRCRRRTRRASACVIAWTFVLPLALGGHADLVVDADAASSRPRTTA